MTRLPILLSLGLCALPAPLALAATGDPLEGTYQADAKGISATVEIDADGDGTLRYSLASECGRTRGAIDLANRAGSLKGVRGSARGAVYAQFKANSDGTLDGLLKHRTRARAKNGNVERCSHYVEVTAVLDARSSPSVDENVGHYEGRGEDGGHPISFDVAFDSKAGELMIKRMAFETDTECYDDHDDDGEDDTLVVKASGLEGSVDQDGRFDLVASPTDETDFYAEGVLRDGEAQIDVEIGGFFDSSGVAEYGGLYECDSFGEVYRASRG